MAKDKDEKKDGADKAELSPEEAAAKAKKRKLLIIIVGGVVLTAGVGGGLAFFLSGGSSAKKGGEHGEEVAAESEHGTEKKTEGEEKKAEGEEKKAEGEEKKAEGEEKKAEGGEKKAEGGEKKADGGKKEESQESAKIDGVDFGCTKQFEAFHLNLGNPLENRYVRLELAVEYGCEEEVKAELDRRLPQLRDAIISVASRKTREFLLGPDGKEQLRKEIHTRINQYMSRKIDDVFITDILIE